MKWFEVSIYAYLAVALLISLFVTLYQVKHGDTERGRLKARFQISDRHAFLVMILTCYAVSLIWIIFVPLFIGFCFKCLCIVFKSIYRVFIR